MRFDPNLDRKVSPEEFETVIVELAAHYIETEGDDIRIADLKAPKPKPARDEHPFAEAREARGIPGSH